jgi:hypothetical protein
MLDDTMLADTTDSDSRMPSMSLNKWAALASFMLAAVFIVPSLMYLTGNLQAPGGLFAYALADFLFGPVWAASLVAVIFVLREHIGRRAQRRMSLALLAAVLAAGAMVAVASVRAANRHYHVTHPELHLENSTTVLVVWGTLVAGLAATGFHFLGWAWLLVGWSGWTSGVLPRLLNASFLVAGAVALFVYALPQLEGWVLMLGLAVSIWLGIVLLKSEPQ